jgi:hypothetical protein
VKAPVRFSEELQRQSDSSPLRSFFFLDSEIEYVVKSDIVAFYQYVDHSVLAEELRIRGGDFDAILHLIELLQDVQGRTYGLPQLLDSSDHLSEVYIDRVERHMLRRGIPTWRFNDDFRMACKSYHGALAAIEELDTAARSVGLVISDSKTLTYRLTKYMMDSLDLEIQPGQSSIALDDIEAAVGDYTDDFSQDSDAAKTFIGGARPFGDENASVNLHRVGQDNVRLLRRAVQSLTQAGDPGVLVDVQRLFTHVPTLTPTLLNYVSAVSSVALGSAVEVLDRLIASASMNEWQRQWMIQTFHELRLLRGGSVGDQGARLGWVKRLMRDSPSPVTVAYATLALAAASAITFDEVMQEYERAPTPLLSWHASALRLSAASDVRNNSSLTAAARTSPIHLALMGNDAP